MELIILKILTRISLFSLAFVLLVVSFSSCSFRETNSMPDTSDVISPEFSLASSSVRDLWSEYVVDQDFQYLKVTYHMAAFIASSDVGVVHIYDDEKDIKSVIDALKEIGNAECIVSDNNRFESTPHYGNTLIEFMSDNKVVFSVEVTAYRNEDSIYCYIASVNDTICFEINGNNINTNYFISF